MITFEEYRKWQPKFAAYELNDFSPREAQAQAILEMTGEAGEVLQILTKANRKGLLEIPREKILDELGDTFWGLVGVMNTFDISLEELMFYNFIKLEERFQDA